MDFKKLKYRLTEKAIHPRSSKLVVVKCSNVPYFATGIGAVDQIFHVD